MIKYLIEDLRTGKWLCLGEMIDTSKHDDSHWESKWTNDPKFAISWDSKEEAEAHNKKYHNMPDIEVTEHEFVSTPAPHMLSKEEAIKDFNRVINALALELPEAVWNDVHYRWIQFQNMIK